MIWHFLTSGTGLVLIGTLGTWVGAVNLSSSAQDLVIIVTEFLFSYPSVGLLLVGVPVAIAVAYRYSKMTMFLTFMVLATFYLTPLSTTPTMPNSYRQILTSASIALFALAAVLYGLKRRRRQSLTGLRIGSSPQ